MDQKKEVIVIGGGVIGLACAHYLAESGASVRIVEQKEIGQAASHGNCGLLCFSDVIPLCSPGTVTHEIMRALKGTSPLYIKPTLELKRLLWFLKFSMKCNGSHKEKAARAKFEILKYSADLFDPLLALDGMGCDFEKRGLLCVFKERENFESYRKTNDFLDRFGMGGRSIDKKQLLEMEPALSGDVVGGWLNPVDWHLRPDMLMGSWRDRLSREGVRMEEDAEVLDFETEGDIVTGVKTASGRFKADAFVLATGAWSPLTLARLGLDLPVQPGKGYSITMERPGVCPTHPCVLYEKKVVATPWKSAYRLGGTMEFSGYSDDLNPGRLGKLVSGAREYLREPLGHPVLEEWTGLRPMTYDDMPVIDRAPSWENLVVAAGHGMLGLTLATGTGKIVSDLIHDRKPEIDISPFRMTRFK